MDTYSPLDAYNPRPDWGRFWRWILLFAICVMFWGWILFLGFKGCARAEEINMQAIAQIESSNNPMAYNEKSGAIGLFQITRICLIDYNQFHTMQYRTIELYNPIVNRRIAEWYICNRIPQFLRHYRIPITVENVIFAYNAGIGRVVKGTMPRETREYIRKYKEASG